MDVHIHPDQEAFIRHRVNSGRFANADEVVQEAISRLEKQEKSLLHKSSLPRKSLAELFAESPFRELDLEFSRTKDGLRPFEP